MNWFQKVWKDNVGGKVIATWINDACRFLFVTVIVAIFSDGIVKYISYGLIILLIATISYLVLKKPTKAAETDYGFKILFPDDYSEVISPVKIFGTFKSLPNDSRFFVIVHNGETRRFFPKFELTIDHGKKEWNSTVNIGGGYGEKRKIFIASVSSYAIDLVTDPKLILQGIPETTKLMQTEVSPLCQVIVRLKPS